MNPLLAQQIIAAVDARFDQLMRQQPRTAYGVVATVDTANRKASVYLSGDTNPSSGFSYAYGAEPVVGALVRVVVDPRGDRYIDGAPQDQWPAKLRAGSTSDASLVSTEHGLQIGYTSGENIIADANEIMARNNGAASTLHLNAEGGAVTIGNNVAGRDRLVAAGLVAPSAGLLFAQQNYESAAAVSVAGTDVDMWSGFRVTYPGNPAMTGLSVILLAYFDLHYSWGAVNTEHNVSLMSDAAGGTRHVFTRDDYVATGVQKHNSAMALLRFTAAQTPVEFKIMLRRTNPNTASNITIYSHASATYVSRIGYAVLGYA